MRRALRIVLCLLLTACSNGFSLFGDSKQMLAARAKIEQAFQDGKPLCFGRFVLRVPRGTEVGFGESSGAGIDAKLLDWPAGELDARVARLSENLRRTGHKSEPGGLLRHIEQEPITGAWILAHRGSAENVWGYYVPAYLAVGNHIYELAGGVGVGEGSYEPEVARVRAKVRRFHARGLWEVPDGPGFCAEDLFISDDGTPGQEIVQIGLVFPQWPDVQVSLTFNRDAEPEHYFGKDLLTRMGKMEHANDEIPEGIHNLAESVRVLRKGKAEFGNWKGQEWLATMADARAHEFKFESPHQPGNALKPNFNLELFSGLKDGERWATKPSLSDDEAIALYEFIMTNIRPHGVAVR